MMILALLLTSAASGPAHSQEVALLEVPVPELGAEEPEVRKQMVALREQLDELLEALGTDGGDRGGEENGLAGADPEQIALLAEKYSELGRLYHLYELCDLADTCLTNALALVPEADEWRYVRAVVRSLNGAEEAALEDFDLLLESKPNDLAALIRSGDLLFDLSRYPEARERYQQAARVAPEEAAGVAGLGQVAFRLGQSEKAVELLTRALELQPTADSLNYPLAQSLRALGRNQAAREALKKNHEGRVLYPDPVIDGLGNQNRSSLALMHAGNLAMRRGQMAEAEGFFRRFLLRRPDHSVALHNLGLVLLAQQKREAGLAALRKAVELDPEFRGGHYFLASALAEDGHFEEALKHYRIAHQIDPDEREIHADYATLLARMGHVDEAIEELKPVVETDPDAHYLRLKYASILATSGHAGEARPLLEDLTREGMAVSVRAEALYHLAILDLDRGDSAGARRLLEKSLELGGASGPANAALGQLLARSGDLAGAVDRFARAIKAQPFDARSQFGYAMSLLLMDRDAEARAALERAIGLLPDHRALRHMLARVLAASSDKSVRDGQRALEITSKLMKEQLSLEYAETLAMAFAEVGRFDEALGWQRRVVEQAAAAGLSGAEQLTQVARVSQFEQGKPVRDPWEPR